MNRQFGHERDEKGRVRIKEITPPRALKGMSADSAGTVRQGPVSRLLGAALDRLGR